MEKKVLSQQVIYFGEVKIPKGFEIDKECLSKNILHETYYNQQLPCFAKHIDQLNSFIKDHVSIENNFKIYSERFFGNMYKPGESSPLLLGADFNNLKNSVDYTTLYGIDVNSCFVNIYFDDNRKKERMYRTELKTNMFLMFPSTNKYIIENKQEKSFNFVETITYAHP